MANSEALYSKVPSDDVDSQRRFSKKSIALVGGSCLVLLSVVAMFAWSPTLNSTNSAVSTSLFGVPASLRAAKQATPMLSSKIGTQLPGAGPWKDLTLATMDAANRCARDVSMNANGIKRVMAEMSAADMAMLEQTGEKVAAASAEYLKKVDPKEFLKAGQVAPLGFWDPWGVTTNNDISAGKLLYYREAEIKHGRVCMLAFLGTVVGEQFRPLLGGTDVAGFAHAWTQAPSVDLQNFWYAAFLQNIAAIAYLEVNTAPPMAVPGTSDWGFDGVGSIDQNWFVMKDLKRVPGDLGFDPLGLKPKTEKDFLELQNKEILNGRLAIIAVLGIFAQEAVTGQHVFR